MAPGRSKLDEPQPEEVTARELQPSTDLDYSKLDPKLRKIAEMNSKPGPFGLLTPIVWGNVLTMVVLHFMALVGAVIGHKATVASWLFNIPLYMMSALGVSAGAHRLWTHRTYKARLPLRILLMCWNCISIQNDILEWCRDHRVHHKFTETHADPHNAKRGFFFAHVGWLLMKKHPAVLVKGRSVDVSDVAADPVVAFQHRHYLKLCVLFSIILPVFIPWYFWGEDPWIAFFVLFAFRYVMTLHFTWFVNSAAHLWGSRNYDKTINPADNQFVCIAAIGEGHHNYHHTFPYDYATSEWGPSMNLTTIAIDFWASLGLAYDRKQVSKEAIQRVRRRIGDLSD